MGEGQHQIAPSIIVPHLATGSPKTVHLYGVGDRRFTVGREDHAVDEC
jgi:hypothetical protein